MQRLFMISMVKSFFVLSLIFTSLSFSAQLKAQTTNSPMIDSVLSNLRWVADATTRVIHKNNANTAYMQMFGFDIHSVIGDQNTDIGTLVLQTYLLRIDNLSPHPAMFDQPNDWAFSYRNFNFNYTNTCRHCPNVRIGHFLLPFGLEHTQDTMGQLLDYHHGQNLGHKADWGLTLNKQHSNFEYEIGYSLAGGQKLKHQPGQYMLTGRIGTASNANQVYGLSFIKAKLQQLKRQKIAVDLQFYHQLWGLFAELSLGKEQNNQVTTSLLELNWRNTNENLLIYTQLNHHTKATQADKLNWNVGTRYEPDNKLSFEFKLTHSLNTTTSEPKPWAYSAQLRYRY